MKRLISVLLIVVMAFISVTAYAADAPAYKLGDRVIRQSMKGDDVLEAQKRLAHYQYYEGKLDGIYGPEMLKAVYRFQKKNDLTVDGRIGPATIAKLTSDSANAADAKDPAPAILQSGAQGEAVKELQRHLKETYYYKGEIDGIFDLDVSRAVRAFQESAGLKADSKAGPDTKDALYNRKDAIFNGGIPVRLLDAGTRGYDVYVLQKRLAELQYLTIAPSGYYGEDTVKAVCALEAANGLKETGKAGSIVRRYLWPSTVDTNEEMNNAAMGTPDAPYQDRTLKMGSHGDDVANAQMRLKAARYLLGNADGIFGVKTKEAVEALQADYKLKVDGIIGEDTWKVLKSFNIGNAESGVVDGETATVPTEKIRRGDRGAEVKQLQRALIQLGFLPEGEDDGIFGGKTYAAVRAFQAANGLKVDGVVGTKTMVCLNEVLGVQWDKTVG